ncbi:MAG: hypothetical protein FWE41_00250 [Coriobacteriia bacterium]|nr:hypothetical protein [Coriobacteriia bacterium]
MKRFLGALLGLVLVFSLSPVAFADEAPPTPVSDYAFYALPQLLFLPQHGDASALSLPSDIVVQHAPYGRFNYLQGLSASWDLAAFDASQTGRQLLTGTVILPPGYAYFEDGVVVPLLIQQPVWVFAPDMTERETVIIDQSPLVGYQFPLVSLGTNSEALAALFDAECGSTMLFSTSDRLLFTTGFTIDQDLVDTTASGAYYPYQPALAEGIQVDPLFLLGRSMAVIVVDPNKVDFAGMLPALNTPYNLWGRWLFEAADPEVWITQDDPFSIEPEPVWQHVLGSIDLDDVRLDALVTPTYLDLEFRSLPLGGHNSIEGEFWIQIRYADGVSDYLHLKFDEGLLVTRTLPVGGDRDGGDRIPNPGGGGPGSGGETPGGGGSGPDGGGQTPNPGGGGPGGGGETPGGGGSGPDGGETPGGGGGTATVPGAGVSPGNHLSGGGGGSSYASGGLTGGSGGSSNTPSTQPGGLILESSNPEGSAGALSESATTLPDEAAPLAVASVLLEPEPSLLGSIILPAVFALAILAGISGIAWFVFTSRRKKALPV